MGLDEYTPLTDGKFGMAFRGMAGGFADAEADNLPAYQSRPLTVECWVKLDSKNAFNIIVASGPKHSPSHWELYAQAGSGALSALLPGYEPAEIISERDIADGQWHYVAAVFEPEQVRLYVDGELVKDSAVRLTSDRTTRAGQLSLGMLNKAEGGLGFDGAIDELRISDTVRDVTTVPEGPFDADEHTVGLWHMDSVENSALTDASSNEKPIHVLEFDGRSMDDLDLESYDPGPSPWDGPYETITLHSAPVDHASGAPEIELDGAWQLAEGGADEDRLKSDDWADAIPAEVPGSVHTALVEAGVIPNPTVGKDDAEARMKSTKTWWYKRTFTAPEDIDNARLVFDGVAIRCTVWLNGKRLGAHEGMFGGPFFDVGKLLIAGENTLVVKIDPAPGTGEFGRNEGWRDTVVFNNVYGWHYSNIPSLGIWQSVRIEGAPAVKMKAPFITTFNAAKAEVGLSIDFEGPSAGWAGELQGTIEPDNFDGETYTFTQEVHAKQSSTAMQLRFTVPNPKLWWPVDLGAPNLYRVRLSFVPDNGVPDYSEIPLGIRTIKMAPLPYGPHPRRYNWTFVINGEPTFVKGTGWCTMDPLMDFSRERYDRLFTLAADQHVQMFRAWGSGMPETDEFYDIANRKGIMILQEWPTAWNSHAQQPYDMLEETVRLNTLRIRNNPALAMYGAGNESSDPFGPAIDMMGRYSVELDGTRPYHRAEPWGGSQHNYNCYWGRQPLDHNVKMTAEFWGEFGLACMPVLESVLRYLPEDEESVWPPSDDGSLAHHTPIFNTAEDMSRLKQYSEYFMPQDSLEHFIIGSQLSQATGVRHTLERARTRWPDTTGALYYKMNDNYPAASWSCVDWYGAPKIGHYIFQDSFAPLHGCIVLDSLNTHGEAVHWPVFLLDDTDALHDAEWTVTVRCFDGDLKLVKRADFDGTGSVNKVRQLGVFELSPSENDSTPLLTVVEVKKDGELADRTFYWTNYEAKPGCLMELPKTTLEMKVQGERATVANTGEVPAVAVNVARPGHLDMFCVSDGYFWLDPGETKTVEVNMTDGLAVDAWNVKNP